MNKSIWSALALGIVLILGPISCNPNTPTKDSFALSPPQIEGSRSPMPLGNIGTIDSSSTIHPAGRKIEFEPSQVQGVHITSEAECKVGDKTFLGTSSFSAHSRISLLNFIPESLRKADLADSSQAECRFHVIATNSNGSKHRFRLGPILIDKIIYGDEIVLEVNYQPIYGATKAHRFTREHFGQMSFATSVAVASAHLDCEGLSLGTELVDRDRIQLGDFRLPSAYFNQTTNESLLRRPTQFCRVRARKPDGQWIYSDLFQMEFMAPRLRVGYSALNPEVVHHSNEQDLIRLTITNHDARAWSIEVPKNPIHHSVMVGFPISAATISFAITPRSLSPIVTGGQSVKVLETKPAAFHRLEPQQSIVISIRATPRMSCELNLNPNVRLRPVGFSLKEPSLGLGVFSDQQLASRPQEVTSPAMEIPLVRGQIHIPLPGLEGHFSAESTPPTADRWSNPCR